MKIGIDWGGTKIEGIVLDPQTKNEILRKRVDSPKENYKEIINSKNFDIDINLHSENFDKNINQLDLPIQEENDHQLNLFD